MITVRILPQPPVQSDREVYLSEADALDLERESDSVGASLPTLLKLRNALFAARQSGA